MTAHTHPLFGRCPIFKGILLLKRVMCEYMPSFVIRPFMTRSTEIVSLYHDQSYSCFAALSWSYSQPNLNWPYYLPGTDVHRFEQKDSSSQKDFTPVFQRP